MQAERLASHSLGEVLDGISPYPKGKQYQGHRFVLVPIQSVRVQVHVVPDHNGPLLKIMPALTAKNYTRVSSVTMGYHIRQISESKEPL